MNKNFEIIGKSGISDGRILYFNKLSSTQNWILENNDLIEIGDIIWTKNQTAGIGRLKKNWYSLPDTCLTFSFILKSFTEKKLNMLITQTTAVTVGNILESYGIRSAYKWPNDILVNEKKISGIIADYINNKEIIIVGIGLNVNLSKAQADSFNISQPVTSMKIITTKNYDIKNLLDLFITKFKLNLIKLNNKDKIYFIEKLRKNDYLKDTDYVHLRIGNKIVSGKYNGIDMDGCLLIKNSNNRIKKFWSGELIKA